MLGDPNIEMEHVLAHPKFLVEGNGRIVAMVGLRVCPETSVRITKFSEHEPD